MADSTSISGANSARNCRHAPQGQGAASREAIAIAVNSRAPSLTALNIAVRSAQFVKPNDAFSMLQP